jgi:hemerythrin-like domain-containing protein
MRCTDLLIQDHKIILRALDVLEHMARRIANDKPVDAADVHTMLSFLRGFADDHHQAKEESALFPELMKNTTNRGALQRMIFEHDQERSLVDGLEDALRTRKGTEFVHFAESLAGILRTHIQKEEKILFPIADEVLSTEQDEGVCLRLNQFEIDAGYLADLRRLEWAYLSRTSAA